MASALDKKQDRAQGLGIALGIWGIISGIALFLTWDTFWRHEEKWFIVVELVVAMVAALIIESARERVEGHERKSSILTTILILLVLEFFLLAWHGIPSLRGGDLREISLRILGDSSAARPATFYPFDITAPYRLESYFQTAHAIYSTNDQQRAQALRNRSAVENFRYREKSLAEIVESIQSGSGSVESLLARTNDNRRAREQKPDAEMLRAEERREETAYRILQAQPPELLRPLLASRLADTNLDNTLLTMLNKAIESADFYRYAATNGADKDSTKRREWLAHHNDEPLPLPRQAEIRRVSRRAIEAAFFDVIVRLPEPARGEWVDLLLAVLPLMFIGGYLGFAAVEIPYIGFADIRQGRKASTTLKAFGWGAFAGFMGGLIAFFAYLCLMRAGTYMFARFIPHEHSHGFRLVFSSLAAAGRYMLRDAPNCFQPAIVSAAVFAFPAGTMCAIVPWLKPSAQSPKVWSVVAVVAAALAAIVSVLTHSWYWWIVILSLIAIVIFSLVRSGRSIEWYWATAVSVVALLLCSVTITAQASLGSILKDAHLFVQTPANPLAERAELFRRLTGGGLHANDSTPKGVGLNTNVFAKWDEFNRWNAFEKSDQKAVYDKIVEEQKQSAKDVGQALEICVIAGLAFWVTIAALATWKELDSSHHGVSSGG